MSFPTGASNLELRITRNGSSSCSANDADLYLYAGNVSPSPKAGGWLARPYTCGAEEDVSSSVAAGNTYTVCVNGYTSFTNVAILAGYESAGSGNSGNAGLSTPTEYFAVCYRDLLFWPAYHRVCCLVEVEDGVGTVRSSRDYDGFSDGNYCRQGEHWKNGPESHEASYTGEYTHLGDDYDAAKTIMDGCGTDANTGHQVANYARRSPGNACPYNIFTDCNSDCWIKDFTQCVADNAPGTGTNDWSSAGISIAATSCTNDAHGSHGPY